jgi:hypothetical protein
VASRQQYYAGRQRTKLQALPFSSSPVDRLLRTPPETIADMVVMAMAEPLLRRPERPGRPRLPNSLSAEAGDEDKTKRKLARAQPLPGR